MAGIDLVGNIDFQPSGSSGGGGGGTASYGGVSCGKTSDQAISSATLTDVTWTNQVIAPTSHVSHSTGTNPAEVTINTADKYSISGIISADYASNGGAAATYVKITVNGTEVARYQASAWTASPIYGPIPFMLERAFSAADVVKIQFYPGATTATIHGQTSSVNRTHLQIKHSGS